ncbi:MAG: gamma-glutamyltransferase [Caldilineaceae bacterium SB0675_bin_29]|uniref:Glutathione hydrolase proenzyme n=1 Tax=Caldilineaceae bacterium SB0675_bin_29 TaxID=2605266 RepID=A0A6B1G5G2_9CHLR|nr:gamma-glutamyltransferase [Caldilineaceae bacterium SB0675_bin_29]
MQSPHGITASAFRPSVMGRNGMVASGHALASQAGIQALMAGGNAVDAAIATAAALGVVEPAGSGVGGDGFILIYWAETGEVSAVNATGPAPGSATRERYLADGGIPMKGIRSVSVPGLVDGWLLAHERYGGLPLEKVFRPAISLCEDGFPVSHLLAEQLRGEHGRFAADPHTRAVYTDDGEPIPTGSLLCNRNLGTTLRKIAQDGRKTLYEGEIARAIADFSRAHDGFLTEEDLGNFHAHWAEPIHVGYRGYEVYEMPPNSSGHILLQELNIVELFDLQTMGCNTAESVHMMVEAKKLAFADREKYMADPEWVDIPLEGMLSKSYAAEQAERIDMGRAAVDVAAGGPEAHEDTTCFCTADRAGNLVCILQSIQSGFGSSLIAGETGILLNNRMTYWHLEEGHPNCLMPGKRVRHTMNPVIVTKDGRPVLTCGTPGADTQVQTNLQLVTHMLDFGMTPQEAVAAPRWRSLQNPMESTIPHVCSNNLQVEDRFPEAERKELARRGHELEMVGDWGGPGSAQAIMVHPESGALIGGSDPRRDGYAVGY